MINFFWRGRFSCNKYLVRVGPVLGFSLSPNFKLFPNPLLPAANMKQLFALAWAASERGWDKKTIVGVVGTFSSPVT